MSLVTDKLIRFFTVKSSNKFREFKKLEMVKSFIELYQHYFKIFLISKGYFSKNLPYNKVNEICRSFWEAIHIPPEALEVLQAREIDINMIGKITTKILEFMSQISENDIITTFSQLTRIKVN